MVDIHTRRAHGSLQETREIPPFDYQRRLYNPSILTCRLASLEPIICVTFDVIHLPIVYRKQNGKASLTKDLSANRRNRARASCNLCAFFLRGRRRGGDSLRTREGWNRSLAFHAPTIGKFVDKESHLSN